MADAAPTTPGGRRRRGSLTADDIVTATVDLIETNGLAALTMAAVAASMDAAVTSIYWHFRTKDDLLLAVAARVTEDLYSSLPPADGDRPWADELFAYFSAFRLAMLGSHAFVELFAVHPRSMFAIDAVAQVILERLEAEVAAIARAGLTTTEAVHIYRACSTYVRGFVTIEIGFTAEAESDKVDTSVALAVIRERQRHLDPVRFPHMAQIDDLENALHYDDAQFEYGLRLVIDGIRSRLS